MKKEALFVCLHRPDRSPSQRFRFEQYINFLNSNGFNCRHVFLLNEKMDIVFYSDKKYLRKLFIVIKSIFILLNESFLKKHDVVFVQREAFMLGTTFFERQFAKRSKLIFDFDDSIWRQQTGDIKSNNKMFYFLKKPNKTVDIIKIANMVFAGNQYLADFAKEFNDNVKIIPTTIDTVEYKSEKAIEKDSICIGWSGSFSTIIHFEHIVDALMDIEAKYGDKIYFKVIGDGSFHHKELGIQGIPWRKDNEIEELSEIDIGVMPLPDDEWTKGKCALKGLQYMALGIPTIMSPVGVNVEVISNGVNGLLASTKQEWISALSELIDSSEKRKEIGRKGRDTVTEKYSVLSNQDLYLKYFNELLER